MKVVTADGRWFALQAETASDTAFMDAIDMSAHSVHVVRLLRTDGRNTVAVLSADRRDPRALVAEASRETARTLGQLMRLLLRQPALDGHISTDPPNPEPQEQLAARLEQLQLMLDAGRDPVGEEEAMLKEVKCTHRCTLASDCNCANGESA
ncbi:hypothetical protein ABIC63_000796 [Pseudacidovorax sp. 1753]|uniref:hypothetical protein n=1 Tax=Pseudacidovorax sp. 1753 TaxID=3156419 RepID=UPI0033977333